MKNLLNKFIYVFTIVGVMGNLPQLYKIWFERNTSGVSLLTWLGFFIGSLFWLFYGFVHKEKPIIYMNFLFATIQLFIVIGLLM